MGTTVNIQITASGQGAAQVIQQLRNQLQGLRNPANQATRSGHQFADALKSIRNQALAVGIAFKGALAFGRFIQEGLKFNEVVESATLGIAALITAEAELVTQQGEVLKGTDALAGAMIHATNQIHKLRVAGLQTAATTEQLTDAFQQSVGAGLAAGLQLDEIRKLTIQIVQAAGALGVPLNQLNQEVRSILDATIDRNSRVARVLGITNAEVRANRELGTLYKFLNSELESFSIASDQAANTWRVIKSNVLEAFQVFAGDATKPFFDLIKDSFKGALEGVFDFDQARISKQFAGMLEGSQAAFRTLGELVADAIDAGVRGAQGLSIWFQENRVQVELFLDALEDVARELGGLIKDAIKLGAAIFDWGVKSGVFVGTLNVIRDTLGIIRDFLPVIAGFIGVKIIAAMTLWVSRAAMVQRGFLGITAALSAFNLAFATNPIGLALLGIGIAGAAAVLAINNVVAAQEQRAAIEERILGIQARHASEAIRLSTEYAKLADEFERSTEEGAGLAKEMEALARLADELIAKDERYRVVLQDQSAQLKKTAADLRANALARVEAGRTIRKAEGVIASETATEKQKSEARVTLKNAQADLNRLSAESIKLGTAEKRAQDDVTESIQKRNRQIVAGEEARVERGKMTVQDLKNQIAAEDARIAALPSVRGSGVVPEGELDRLTQLNAALKVAENQYSVFALSAQAARKAADDFDAQVAEQAPIVKPIRGTDSEDKSKRSKQQNDLKQQAEAEIRAVKAILDEVESQLDEDLKTRKIGVTEFATALKTAQLAALDREQEIRERLRNQLDDKGEQAQQLGRIREIQAERVKVINDANIQIYEDQKRLDEAVNDLRRKVLDNEGKSFDESADAIKSQFQQLIEDLKLAGREADIGIVLKFIGQETMKQEVEKFKDETDDLGNQLQTRLQSIEARRIAGVLNPDQAKDQVIFVYEQIIAKLKEAREAYGLLVDETGQRSPEMQDAIDKISEKLTEMEVDLEAARTKLGEFGKQMIDVFKSGIVEFLTADLSALDKFDNAFRSMAQSVVNSMRRIIAEMLAFQAIKGLFRLFGFDIVGSGFDITGIKRRPKAADGGLVGALKYADGGLVEVVKSVQGKPTGGGVAPVKAIRMADGGSVDVAVNEVVRKRRKEDEDEEREIIEVVRRSGGKVATPQRFADGGVVAKVPTDDEDEIVVIEKLKKKSWFVPVDARTGAGITKPPMRFADGGAVPQEAFRTTTSINRIASIVERNDVLRRHEEEEEDIRRRRRRDEDEEILVKVQRKARGGTIRGPGGEREDKVPIWASPGEYILSAPVVRAIGVEELDRINFGASRAKPRSITSMTRHFKDGGAIVPQESSTSRGGFDATIGLEQGLVVKHLKTREGTRALLEHIDGNKDAFQIALGLY
jgi:hypothetical protein